MQFERSRGIVCAVDQKARSPFVLYNVTHGMAFVLGEFPSITKGLTKLKESEDFWSL